MSYYDVLYGVVLRLPGENGGKIIDNIDEITQQVGKALQKEFKDFYVMPYGMELVEDDKKLRILNRIEFVDDFSEEDDYYEE